MSLRDQLLTADTPAEIAEVLDQYVRNEIVRTQTNATTGATELLGPDGVILYGQMVSGAWMKMPSIFRLRLTGTGTVTIDSKDSLGNITSAVATYIVSGATDQIEFPYAGDNAVAIRATFSGDITVEVI
jgi:hypothetical protein